MARATSYSPTGGKTSIPPSRGEARRLPPATDAATGDHFALEGVVEADGRLVDGELVRGSGYNASVNWFKHLPPAAQAAVIAGAIAILTALITAISTATNAILKAHLDRQAAARAEAGLRRDLYRKYADPLTSAAESLFWRLHEIFEDGRSGYLAPGGGRTRFESYKASSTRYRLACLLGWITALQKELTLCNAQPDGSVAALRNALGILEHALAEGGHIERYRASKLAELWDVRMTQPDVAGRAIDPIIDRCRHEHGAVSVQGLEADQQLLLLRRIATVLSSHSTGNAVDIDVIEATREEAIGALMTREAWIYRDWQAAIGDWMLIHDSGGVRRFDVRSYRSFVGAEVEPSGDDEQWMARLSELTDDLDVQGEPLRDARIEQLKQVYSAVATLILRFHDAAPNLSAVGDTTVMTAKAVSGGATT